MHLIKVTINIEENNKGENREYFNANLSDIDLKTFRYMDEFGIKSLSTDAIGTPVADYSDIGVNGWSYMDDGTTAR